MLLLLIIILIWTASHFQSLMFSFVLYQSFILIFQGYYRFVCKHKKKYTADEAEEEHSQSITFTHIFWSRPNPTPWRSDQSRNGRHISVKCLCERSETFSETPQYVKNRSGKHSCLLPNVQRFNEPKKQSCV